MQRLGPIMVGLGPHCGGGRSIRLVIERLSSFSEILGDWQMLERLADQTPEIDTWCSGPDWVVPVHTAFGAGSEPLVIGSPEAGGVALLASYVNEHEEPMLAGMEPLWGFSCPVLTADPAAFAPVLAKHLSEIADWRYLVMPGMPTTGPLAPTIADELASLGRVGAQEGMTRMTADLRGNADAWFARRTNRFRRQVTKATEHAVSAGVTFEDVTAPAGLMDRLVSIEERGWKGLQDDGITTPSMRNFYTEMIDRLGERGRLRATIATLEGQDVGFILGGLRNNIYRGLQLSYTESVSKLSLGHVLQFRELTALGQLGVTSYDMGMDMEYKRRWADRAVPSLTLIVLRE